MILCFGTFASVLFRCSWRLSQDKFVPKVAWVVDRRNSSLASNLNFDVDDPDGMEGNKSVVSKLLSCSSPFILRDNALPSVEVARDRFKSKVMPYIDEDKVAAAVLAICSIISNDATIATERKESFKKYLGMYQDALVDQTEWDVPDFMTRILLYTTCVDNRVETRKTEEEAEEKEKLDVAKIMDRAIEDAANSAWVKCKWDTDTQILKMTPTAEKRIWDKVRDLSNLRMSAINRDMELDRMRADTSWLGIDERDLFPNVYGPEITNPKTRRQIMDKTGQVTKLLAELNECLASSRSSTVRWPVFPSERVRNLVGQIETLCDDVSLLAVMDGFSHQT